MAVINSENQDKQAIDESFKTIDINIQDLFEPVEHITIDESKDVSNVHEVVNCMPPEEFKGEAMEVLGKTQENLIYLEKNFKMARNVLEKVNILIQIAQLKERKAEEKASLEFWELAKLDYQNALTLEKTNIKAGIGFSRCLLHLSKYSKVISYLKDNKNFSNVPEYWYNLGFSYRKQRNYDKAEECIIKALEKDPHNTKASKEKALILKLQENPTFEQEPEIDTVEDYFQRNQRTSEDKRYKILSIDGGGVRGIIPALWLNEIERRTKKPISHLFDMVAGTSVGGIIAAGLTIPSIVREPIYDSTSNTYGHVDVLSSYKPRYKAYNILQLLYKHSKDIFTSDNSFCSNFNLKRFFGPKYEDKRRKKLFQDYFGNAQIKDSLTHLIIPAYWESIGNQTYLFKSKHHINNTKSFVDVLMATSAAPTFFPSYKIEGMGNFLDGGVNLNNPAMRVYTESLEARKNRKTFLLSLGTGAYTHEPENPDKSKGLFHYAMNFHRIALNPQEENAHIELECLLKNYENKNVYQRWQVPMEKPIPLDAYASLDDLIEMGKEYIEEHRDQLNKCIEILLKD